MDRLTETIDASIENDTSEMESLTVHLSWISRRRLEQELDVYGLTPPQYMAMRCMQGTRRECSMTELAEASYQVSATMTGIIDRLEERGLVQRERDPRDRRAQRVALTQAGEQLLEQISQTKRAWIKQFLSSLTAEERRMMIDLSRRYLSVVESTLRIYD